MWKGNGEGEGVITNNQNFLYHISFFNNKTEIEIATVQHQVKNTFFKSPHTLNMKDTM